jgi:hypothetical protein
MTARARKVVKFDTYQGGEQPPCRKIIQLFGERGLISDRQPNDLSKGHVLMVV